MWYKYLRRAILNVDVKYEDADSRLNLSS